MRKFVLLAALILLVVTAYAAIDNPAEQYTGERTIETENFRFHIEPGYGPATAGMENLVQHTYDDDSKRDIYLQKAPLGIMVARCNTLYDYSRTRNPNPCGKLTSRY